MSEGMTLQKTGRVGFTLGKRKPARDQYPVVEKSAEAAGPVKKFTDAELWAEYHRIGEELIAKGTVAKFPTKLVDGKRVIAVPLEERRYIPKDWEQPAASRKLDLESMYVEGASRWGEALTQACAVCGEQFVIRNKGQRHCSRSCGAQGRRRVEARACETCGAEFRPQAGNHDARFCSRACVSQSRAVARERVCETCGEPFTLVKNRQRFCSRSCGQKARWRVAA